MMNRENALIHAKAVFRKEAKIVSEFRIAEKKRDLEKMRACLKKVSELNSLVREYGFAGLNVSLLDKL